MGQGAKRQAVTYRAITRNEENLAAPCFPFLADPAFVCGGLGVPRLHRKNITRRCRQPAFEHAGKAIAFFRVFQFRVGRIDIFGKTTFLDDPFGRILIGRKHQIGLHTEMSGDTAQ